MGVGLLWRIAPGSTCQVLYLFGLVGFEPALELRCDPYVVCLVSPSATPAFQTQVPGQREMLSAVFGVGKTRGTTGSVNIEVPYVPRNGSLVRVGVFVLRCPKTL